MSHLPQYLLPYTKYLAFNQKPQDMPKGKKKHSEEIKWSPEPDRYDTAVGTVKL